MSINSTWPNGWAWNSGYPVPEPNTSQLEPNVQVVKIDWKDMIGAQGTNPSTSGTSPFKFSWINDNSINQNQQNNPTGAFGIYTGKGLRSREIEGQEPARFGISVGKCGGGGEFGQSNYPISTDAVGNCGYEYDEKSNSQTDEISGGNKTFVSEEPEMIQYMTWLQPPQYQPCGNCKACVFQQSNQKKMSSSSEVPKSKNFLCRINSLKSELKK